MIEKLKEIYGLQSVVIAKPAHGGSAEITINKLLSFMLVDSSTEDLAKSLGIGRTTLYRMFSRLNIRLVPGVPVNKYCSYLAGYKKCSKCENLLSLSKFGYDRHNRTYDKHSSACLVCSNSIQNVYRSSEAYSVMYHKHYNNRAHVYKTGAANYRAAKLQQYRLLGQI